MKEKFKRKEKKVRYEVHYRENDKRPDVKLKRTIIDEVPQDMLLIDEEAYWLFSYQQRTQQGTSFLLYTMISESTLDREATPLSSRYTPAVLPDDRRVVVTTFPDLSISIRHKDFETT